MNDLAGIGALVPQSGSMVLLDEVVMHDERHIRCRARSHRDSDHPLARDGVLPVFAGIEYAAQAMAAHFSLTSGLAGSTTIGLLGSLRDVVFEVERLDNIGGALIIACERLSHDRAGSIYAFDVAAEDDGRLLLRGRATVVQRGQEAS